MAPPPAFEVRTNSCQDDADKIREYWTEERKKRARPVGWRQGRGRRFAVRGAAFDAPLPPPSDAKSCFAMSAVSDLAASPYRQVGKLFVVLDGKDGYGSAWVTGDSTVATAGHLLHQGGSRDPWAEKVLFEAQHDDGSNAGSWPILCLAALKNWVVFGDWRHDMGIGIAESPVSPVTGKLGWLVHQTHDGLTYVQSGYPQSAGGKKMWKCEGDYVVTTDSRVEACSGLVEGASGGPWAVSHGGPWQVVGLTSDFSVVPGRIESPYFGDNLVSLMDWMTSNGGD